MTSAAAADPVVQQPCMKRIAGAVAAAILLIVPAAALPAQVPDTAFNGEWVRVVAETRPGELEGRLIRADASSLSLALRRRGADSVVTLPRAAIRELWLRSTASRKTAAGAAIGSISGGLAGGLIANGMASPCTSIGCELDEVGNVALGALVGAGAGAVIGALIGHNIAQHRWRRVRLPGELTY